MVYGVRLMRVNWKRAVRGACTAVAVYATVVAGLITFGTAKPPIPAPAISMPFAEIDTSTLPELERYRARDGTFLSYREYRASPTRVAVLVHGSAGSSIDMHPLALALQGAGFTVLVPDVRGHGANRPHGDIRYVGQLDDDLADLINALKRVVPGSTWTIVGFSSGAGFALRFAANSKVSELADRYVLISPYLRYNAPSVRESASGGTSQSWAKASVGRIVGLTMANRWGLHAWDGLPVLAFPVSASIEAATHAYSWRLYKNFGADDDYLADMRRASRPMQVLVGDSDGLLDAAKLKIEFQSQRPETPVSIIPGMGHSEMVTRPAAILEVVAKVAGR